MSRKVLQIVTNELLQRKLVAETNIESFLMDQTLNTKKKVNKIIKELDDLKDSSLMINFWENFVDSNIVIPGEENNNKEK